MKPRFETNSLIYIYIKENRLKNRVTHDTNIDEIILD